RDSRQAGRQRAVQAIGDVWAGTDAAGRIPAAAHREADRAYRAVDSTGRQVGTALGVRAAHKADATHRARRSVAKERDRPIHPRTSIRGAAWNTAKSRPPNAPAPTLVRPDRPSTHLRRRSAL